MAVVYAVAIGEPSFGTMGPLVVGLALFTMVFAGSQYTGVAPCRVCCCTCCRALGPDVACVCRAGTAINPARWGSLLVHHTALHPWAPHADAQRRRQGLRTGCRLPLCACLHDAGPAALTPQLLTVACAAGYWNEACGCRARLVSLRSLRCVVLTAVSPSERWLRGLLCVQVWIYALAEFSGGIIAGLISCPLCAPCLPWLCPPSSLKGHAACQVTWGRGPHTS